MLSWFKSGSSSSQRGSSSASGSSSSSYSNSRNGSSRDAPSSVNANGLGVSVHSSRLGPLASPSAAEEGDAGYDDVPLSREEASNGASTAAPSRSSFSIPTSTAGSFVNSSYPPPSSASSIHLSSTNGYPPLQTTFNKLSKTLSNVSPILLDSLSPSLLNSNSPALLSLENTIAPYRLPKAVRDCYLIYDGQEPFSNNGGLVYGLRWMPIDEVEQEYLFWRRFEIAGGLEKGGFVDDFGATFNHEGVRGGGQGGAAARSSSRLVSGAGGRINPFSEEEDDEGEYGMSAFPDGWVRKRYSHPGWLPLLTDKVGNYIGVDLDPPPPSSSSSKPRPPSAFSSTPNSPDEENTTFGQPGQVIAFGRELDEKTVLFPGDSSGGWGRFLAAFVDDLERKSGMEAFARLGEGRSVRNGRVIAEEEEEEWNQEDGLGDRNYLDGDRYGEEANESDSETEGVLWVLGSEAKKWLGSSEGHGGVIGALAERSRKQWRSVGIGLARRRRPSSQTSKLAPALAINIPYNSTPLTVKNLGDDGADPRQEEDEEAEPQSAATERPTPSQDPNLLLSSLDINEPSSSSSPHPLSPPPVEESSRAVEVVLSPPSPAQVRQPSNSSSVHRSPASPTRSTTSSASASSSRHPQDPFLNPRSRPFQKRRPPPPPAAPIPLDLPSVFDFDNSSSASTSYSLSTVIPNSPSLSRAGLSSPNLSTDTSGFGPSPTTGLGLTKGVKGSLSGGSTTALVEGGDDLGHARFEVVIGDGIGGLRGNESQISVASSSDQPYGFT